MRGIVDLPSATYESIFSCDDFACNDRLPSRRESPTARTKSFIQNSSVLDLRQVYNPVGFNFYVSEFEWLLKDLGLLWSEGGRGEAMEGTRPVDLSLVFGEDRGRVGEAFGEGAQGLGFVGGGEVVGDLGGVGGGFRVGRCGWCGGGGLLLPS